MGGFASGIQRLLAGVGININNDNPSRPVISAPGGAAFSGASLRLSAPVTGATWPLAVVPFDVETYDIGDWYKGTPGTFVIPAGVSRVKVMVGVSLTLGMNAGSQASTIEVNGVAVPQVRQSVRNGTASFSSNNSCSITPAISVNPGDVVTVRQSASYSPAITGILADAVQTTFSIEKVS